MSNAVAVNPSRVIAIWLSVVVAMIAAIVMVGGLTRLTDSGLSITEWKPVTGVIPPLSEQAWQEELQKYRSTTEYQVQNKGMSLDAFKTIYWWEWGHRILARAIGLAVLLPLLWFWWRGQLTGRPLRDGVILFALVCAQGLLGWLMVASGLTGRLDVSQYRLAAHLVAAFVIFAWAFTMLLDQVRGPLERKRDAATGAVTALVVCLFIQIGLGGLVAGLDAGLVHTTWPLMDGALVPSGLLFEDPWWRNFGDNHTTVQFQHRIAGYLIALVAVFVLVRAFQTGRAVASGLLVAGLVLAQIVLGVLTLLAGADGVQPVALGAMHQFGALVVLAAALVHRRNLAESAREALPPQFAAPAKNGFPSAA